MREDIETERLRLRRVTSEQARSILAGEMPQGLRLSDGYPSEFSLEVMDLLAGERANEADGFAPNFMIRRDDGAVIGEIGWSLAADEPATAQVGYSVVEPCWGEGYATEALRALLEHVLADPAVERVVADTLPDHVASWRVMEKAGMTELERRLDVDDGMTVEVVRYEARRAR